MTDITKTIAEAREALAKYGKNNPRLDTAMGCAVKLRDLLAALGAAQGEAVVEFMGRRRTPEKTSECWGVMLCSFMQDPPKGTKLYLAPQAPPAAVPAGGLRDSVLNSAKFRASCYALVGIVEGIAGLGRRWASDGERLKDTPEWVAFYNSVAAMRNGTAEPTSAKPAPPAAVANVTPMRQPRADLARLVESINAAVYANGDGLSVTEAIGALELAKLELLKEEE